MQKNILLTGILFFILISIQAQELKMDEILANYYSAVGMENLKNLKTIVMTGSLIRQDVMPLKIIKMRPDKYRMEFQVQDIEALQVYNGQMAWQTMPWTGNPAPQFIPDDKAKDLRNRSDFEGPLYHWKEKGHSLKYEGSENLDSVQVHKLKLIRKDGSIEYYFINAKSFLPYKHLSYRDVRGKETEMEIFFSDYKTVNGVTFAFTTESFIGGQTISRIEYDTIEINSPVDEKIFEMPVK